VSRIFLSYARDDVDAARQLAEELADAGHDVWWDRHLHGGSRFDKEIEEALGNAEAVVVIWSRASLESAWVKDEAAEARDSERLVPISIGSAKPPLGFRQFHTIDLGSWKGNETPESIDELLSAIDRTCGSVERGEKATAKAAAAEQKTSICVLPFANMSGEPEQEYFSDGISEDIITDLSNVSALSVVSRNTSFTFKGLSLDVKEVVEKLRVSHVLEGSVRKSGNRVRITAQLIDGAKDDHVWAARYDRDLTDIFEIQDEISKAIVEALKVKLLPQERDAIENRGTSNVEAYNMYLMARQQVISGDFGDVNLAETAVRLCKQATLLDPNYADAWAWMALAQLRLRLWHAKDVDPLPAAERTLEINSSLSIPYCVKANYLDGEGRSEEAEALIRKALELDPNSWEVNYEASRLLFRHGEISKCIPYFEKAAQLIDNDWRSPMMLMSCFEWLGDKDRLLNASKMTLERTEAAVARDPTNVSALAAGAGALVRLGNEDRAREWIRRALLLDPDNLNMRYNIACTLAVDFGDTEEAVEALEPFFERINSTVWMRHVDADPDLSSIRDDPRFQKMLAAAKTRLGVTEAATAAE
jgi:adenylate cyclase